MQRATHYQDNRSALPALFRRFAFLLTVAVLMTYAAPASAQRFVTDPVEELGQALRLDKQSRVKKETLDFRKANLEAKIASLGTIGELGRAMLLQDWRDEDLEPALAAIDRELRTRVATRFENAVRAVLQRGDVANRWAVANLVGELAVMARGLETKAFFVKNHLASLVPDLIALARTQDDLRLPEAAARALGKIHPHLKDVDSVAATLAGLLKAERSGTRRAAAEALGSLMTIVSQNEKKMRIEAILAPMRQEVVQVGTAITQAAAVGLNDKDAEVRRRCASAIYEAAHDLSELVAEPPVPDFFPPEKRSLDEAERAMIRGYRRSVREEYDALKPLMDAVMKLAQTADSPLARALNDPDLAVRVMTAKAIEDIALTRQRLLKREASIPAWARAEQKQARAITDSPRPPVRPHLEVDKLPAPPLPDLLRQPARGAPRAASAHEESTEHRFTDTELPAELPGDSTWDNFRNTVVSDLARRLLDPEVRGRLAAIDALEMLGETGRQAAPALIGRLTDPDRFVRWSAARTLGRMGPVDPETAVPALARLLGDPDPDLRITAANALERYGPEAKAAIQALAEATATGDTEVRLAALRALEGIGRDAVPAIPTITLALANPDPRVRRLAADLLGRFGPLAQSAVPALRRALEDSDPLVRKSASIALLNMVPLPAER